MAKGTYRRDDANPANLWHDADPEPQPEPKGSSRGGWGKPKGQPKTSHRESRHQQGTPQPSKNQRPEEVSEMVWDLAQQWLSMAEAKYGERPPVNLHNFSKRYSDKINSDPNLRYWLRVKPDQWDKFDGRWKDGRHFLNDVLYKMLRLFFQHLTEQQKIGSVQFAFLNDEWDEWVYQAVTAVQVAWHKDHGTWVKYDLPEAVFDPSTVGKPNPEDPCTDPMFEGLTWGEVWAQDEEDRRSLPKAKDDDDSLAEAMASAGETFARLKSVMVANREKTTTKENDQ
jgi:hypothetical protein